MTKERRDQLWRAAEMILWAMMIGLTIYYGYHFGWTGVAYCVLAATLGGMVIYWFGDLFPIIGPYLRNHANNRDKS